MEKKQNNKPQDDLLHRRPLYLYDLPAEVLDTLTLKSDADIREETIETPAEGRSSSPGPDNAVGSQACSLCSLSFVTVEDQRGHLKSDLHHYNLKQKLRGLSPVSEVEFEKLIGNLDESLSGSESSESEEEEDRKETTLSTLLKRQATLANRKNDNGGEEEDETPARKRGSGKAPLMWFTSPTLPTNIFFGIYRAMFTPEELGKEDSIVDTIKKRQLAPIAMPKPNKDGTPVQAAYKGPHIFLCMIGGGHFAAMVVSLAPRQSKHGASSGPLNREATVLAHKTFHRYTTRRKQGGSQSANDNAKGAAHSAGAGIRRYNEQALIEDVRALLLEWKALLDTSDLLFIRATGSTNRRTLFGPYENQVLRANDPRTRGFPFSTKRATQKELMRSFIELTRLKVHEITPADAVEPAKPSTSTLKPEKPAAPVLSEEEQTALLHTTQLQSLIRRSKLPALLSYLTTNSLEPDFRFYPASANHHAPTPLHMAAAQGSAALVTGLLTRGGADPTTKNEQGKTAFELAGDRSTRDAFRVARGLVGEERWDWEAAGVPGAMSKEEVEKREERERKEEESRESERRAEEEERLRKQKVPSASKPKKGVLTGLDLKKTAQEKREDEARGLTPEQKARLDRERRARAAEERIRRMQGGG